MLEVIDDALAVEKVHCRPQPIPIECLCEAQLASAAGYVGDCNDFLEGYDLYSGDDHDDVDVPSEHGAEEDAYHDKCPYRPRDERLLFLLVIALRRGFLRLDPSISVLCVSTGSVNPTLSSSDHPPSCASFFRADFSAWPFLVGL